MPVVLLNGGTGSWLHWVRTIPALEGEYRVLVPDLPGMGDSAAPGNIEPVEALIEAMGEAVFKGLIAISPSKASHICGFSFGAMVGAFVGAQLGRQLGSYCMLGASGLGLPFPGPRGIRKHNKNANEDALRAVHRANMGAIMFGDAEHDDAEALEMQLINAGKVRVRSHTAATTEVMRAPLKALHGPKLALWGDRDPFFPRDVEALGDLMSAWSFRWMQIPKAGHWAQYHNASEVNRILVEFLGE